MKKNAHGAEEHGQPQVNRKILPVRKDHRSTWGYPKGRQTMMDFALANALEPENFQGVEKTCCGTNNFKLKFFRFAEKTLNYYRCLFFKFISNRYYN